MKRLLSILLILSLLVPLFPQKALALGNVVTISSSSNDALFPVVVADNKGYLHMAWQEYSGSFAQNPGIYYSRWNGDTWSTPLNISENTGYADNVSLTTDSNRTVHFVWNDSSGNQDELPTARYRTRTEAGIFSSIETLPMPAGNIATRNAGIAIDGSGNPNAVYTAIADTSQSVYHTTKSAGSWSTPILVSKNGSDVDLTSTPFSQLKADSSGNLHLTYWDNNAGIFYRKYSAGAWNTAFPVITGAAEFVRMAVTPLGEVFVTWRSNADTSIMVRWTQSGGSWQTAVSLSSNASRSFWGFPIMGVTTDSQERAHVGWGERDESGLLDLKYRSFVAGTWQIARDVDLDNQEADSPFVYPDLWDNQHFAWSELNQTSGKWEILYRVAEGTIQTLSTTGGTITANPFNTTQAVLTVPSGALSASTEIGIQVGPVPENVDPSVVTIPKAYTFRPHGLVFNTPSTARIFYTTSEVGGADENQLQPWLWDSQTGTYTAQTVTNRHTAQNWMEVSLSHFSLYSIAAPKVEAEWKKPGEDISGKKMDYELSLTAGGNVFEASQDPNDLKILLKDSDGDVLQTQKFEKKGIQKTGKTYKGSFSSVSPGPYTLEVYVSEGLISTRQVELN